MDSPEFSRTDGTEPSASPRRARGSRSHRAEPGGRREGMAASPAPFYRFPFLQPARVTPGHTKPPSHGLGKRASSTRSRKGGDHALIHGGCDV